jgi:hypothetical protein
MTKQQADESSKGIAQRGQLNKGDDLSLPPNAGLVMLA